MYALKKLGSMLSDAFTPSYKFPPDTGIGSAIGLDPQDANWTPEEGDWMETALFNKFYFFNPTDDAIDIHDIAQSLGHTARFNGHYREQINFYSVAEHSYLLAEYANLKWGPAAGLEALMHDAAEAYVGDIIRPMKNTFPVLKEAEKIVERAVRKNFGLFEEMPDWMRDLDHRMLAAERIKVKGKSNLGWAGEEIIPLPIQFRFFSPNRARDCFLDFFWQLNHDLRESTR